MDEARRVMQQLAASGVNMQAVTDELLVDGVKVFSDSFAKLLANLEDKRARLIGATSVIACPWIRVVVISGATGRLGRIVAARMAQQGARLALFGRNADVIEHVGARAKSARRPSVDPAFRISASPRRRRPLLRQ